MNTVAFSHKHLSVCPSESQGPTQCVYIIMQTLLTPCEQLQYPQSCFNKQEHMEMAE